MSGSGLLSNVVGKERYVQSILRAWNSNNLADIRNLPFVCLFFLINYINM